MPSVSPPNKRERDVVDDRAVDLVRAAEDLRQVPRLEHGTPPVDGPALARPALRRPSAGRTSRVPRVCSDGTASSSARVYSCCGSVQHRRDRPLLDDLALPHDGHLVGQPRDDREVVADQDDRRAARLRLGEQVEHLGLHGDVEGGGRLVGDDQLRDRARWPRRSARAGAARRTARTAAAAPSPRAPARRPRSSSSTALAARVARVPQPVHPQRLGDLVADPAQLVERGERVLEDEADLAAADRAPGALAAPGQVERRRARSGRPAPAPSAPVRPTSVRAVTLLPEPDSPDDREAAARLGA